MQVMLRAQTVVEEHWWTKHWLIIIHHSLCNHDNVVMCSNQSRLKHSENLLKLKLKLYVLRYHRWKSQYVSLSTFLTQVNTGLYRSQTRAQMLHRSPTHITHHRVSSTVTFTAVASNVRFLHLPQSSAACSTQHEQSKNTQLCLETITGPLRCLGFAHQTDANVEKLTHVGCWYIVHPCKYGFITEVQFRVKFLFVSL